MIPLLIVVFGILSILSFVNFEGKIVRILYFLWGILLILIASFRGEGVDWDYENYVFAFNDPDLILEASFNYVVTIIRLFSDNELFLFIFYAILGVSLNLIAIRKITRLYLMSLFIYFSWFFLLHEMTQIRIGVSCGFLLLCIKPLYERRFLLYALLACLAVFFHYSTILIFLLIFLSPVKLNKKFWLAIVPIGFTLYLVNISFLSMLPLGSLSQKIEVYEELNSSGIAGFSKINVFNPVYLSNIIIYYLLFFNVEKILEENRYVILLLKIYGLALFSFTSLAFITVVASRMYEFLGVVQIILIPFVYYVIKPSFVAKICIWFFGLASIWVMLFFNKIIM